MRYATSELESLSVGEVMRSPGRTVTESDVVAFAALTGDHHPVHVDAVWAGRSAFRQRIAHGMLVLSYAIGLAPMDPAVIVALRGIRQATFKLPVRIGDTIAVEIEVTARRPLTADLEMVQSAWRIRNQDDRLVAMAYIEIVCRRGRRSAEAGSGAVPDGGEVDIASIPV